MGIANKTDLNNRVEALEKGGGGSGTSNYNQLSNRPKINSNLLTGNKTSNQLGLASSNDIATEFSDLTNYNKGDLVYYEGSLYQFQVDHTAGAWESSEAIQKDLSDIINSISGGGGGSSDIYSTTEMLTNKVWIDDKPIYRKVFVSESSLQLRTPNWFDTSISVSDLNIDTITNSFVIGKDTGSIYGTKDTMLHALIAIKTNTLSILAPGVNFDGSIICIEYTKEVI